MTGTLGFQVKESTMSGRGTLKALVMLGVALGYFISLAAPATATDYSWTNQMTAGDGLWNTAANWSDGVGGGAVPTSADTAVLDLMGAAWGPNIDTGAGGTAAEVKFTNNILNYTISGGPLVLGSGLGSPGILRQDAGVASAAANVINSDIQDAGDGLQILVGGSGVAAGKLTVNGQIGDLIPVDVTGSVVNNGTLVLGNAANLIHGSISVVNGGVLDVNNTATGIADVTLTNSKLTLRGTIGSVTPQTNLQAYWDFNEGSGTTVYDQSGNNRNLTLSGTATFGASQALMGTAMRTDGGVGWASLPDATFMNGMSEFTIGMWVDFDGALGGTTDTQRGIMFGKVPDANGQDRPLSIRYDPVDGASGGGTNTIRASFGSTADISRGTATNTMTTTWQHITMTYKSTAVGGTGLVEVYINGVLATGGTRQNQPSAAAMSGITTLFIGRGTKDQTTSWLGLIDEVGIYDRQLTDAEILDLMAVMGATDARMEGTLTIEGNSTVEIAGVGASVAELVFADATVTPATLHVVAEPPTTAPNGLSADSTTFNGGSVTLDAQEKISLGTMNDSNMAVTITKTGPADLVLSDTMNPQDMNDATFVVQQGWLVGIGDAVADPLAGADVELAGGSAAFSSKGGAVFTTGDVAVSQSGTIMARIEGDGIAGQTVSFLGTTTIDAGKTLTLTTANGYELFFDGAIEGDGALTLSGLATLTGVNTYAGPTTVASGLMTVDGFGALAGTSAITIQNGARLDAMSPDTLNSDAVVYAQSGGMLYLGVAQTNFPNGTTGSITIEPFAALGGDMTGARYSTNGGAQNVFLMGDAVLAVENGPEPLRSELATGLLWRGVTSLSGAYTLGDNGVDSIYKGAIFSPAWTPAGNFTGTLSEAAGATGFDVGLKQNLALRGATIQAATGNVVRFTETGILDLFPDSFAAGTTADTFERNGIAPTATAPGTTGMYILRTNGANSIPAGQTWTVTNGLFKLQDSTRNDIQAGAVVNIGENATWYSSGGGNVTGPATMVILDGGAARIAGAGRANTVTWNDGAMLILDYGDFPWTSQGMPTDKRINTFISGGDRQVTQGIYLDNGAWLSGATTAGGTRRVYGGSVTPTTDFAADGAGIIFAVAGQYLNVDMNVAFAGKDLLIGMPAGTMMYLPQGTGTAEEALQRRYVAPTGEVQFRGALSQARNVTVQSGTFRPGYDATDVTTITGILKVLDGATLQIRQANNIQNEWMAGTLGTETQVEKGGQIRNWIYKRFAGGVPTEINEVIRFLGTGGAGKRSTLYIDEEGGVASATEQFIFHHIRMDQGADVYVDTQDMDNRQVVRLSIELNGDAQIGGIDDFAMLNASSLTGNRQVLKLGNVLDTAVNSMVDISIYGAIGDNVTLDLIRSTLYIEPTSSFAAGAVINNLGDTGPLTIGEDGHVQIRQGRDGSPSQFFGQVNLSGRQDISLYVNEVATGNPHIVNTFLGQVNILVGGSYERAPGEPVHGWIRSNRDTDSDVQGWAIYDNVHLQNGAVAEMQVDNEQNLVIDFTLDGAAGTALNYNNSTRIFVRDVTGPAGSTFTLGGSTNTYMIGAVTGADLYIKGTTNARVVYWTDRLAALGAGNTFTIEDGRTITIDNASLDTNFVGADNGLNVWADDLTFIVQNDGRLTVRSREVPTGTAPYVNVVPGKVIIPEGQNGWIRAERMVNSDVNGYVVFEDVELGNNAILKTSSMNDQKNVMHITLDGDAEIYQTSNGDRNFLGSVTGTGTSDLLVSGTANLRLIGPVTGLDTYTQTNTATVIVQDQTNIGAQYVGSWESAGNVTFNLQAGTFNMGNFAQYGIGELDATNTVNLSNNAMIVNKVHSSTDLNNPAVWYVAQYDAVAKVFSDGNPATLDGRFRVESSDYPNADNERGYVYWTNVTLEDGVSLQMEKGSKTPFLMLDLFLEGSADVRAAGTSNGRIGNVTGTAGMNSVLTFMTTGALNSYIYGTLTDVDVVYGNNAGELRLGDEFIKGNLDVGSGDQRIQQTMSLGGNTLTIQNGAPLAIWANPGPGTIVIDSAASALRIYTGFDGNPANRISGTTFVLPDGMTIYGGVGETAAAPNLVNEINLAGTQFTNLTLRSQRTNDSTLDGVAYFRNVSTTDGATVSLSRQESSVMADFILGGALSLNNPTSGGWTAYVGNTSGTGLITVADSVEELRFVGTLGNDVYVAGSATDSIRLTSVALGATTSYFNLNGHTVDLHVPNGEISIDHNIGTGTIIAERGVGGQIMHLRNGNVQQGGSLETAWGTGLNLNMGGGLWLALHADEAANAGERYTNRFQGTITVADNVADIALYDLALQADADSTAGAGEAGAFFEDVRIENGAEVRFVSQDGAFVNANFTLLGATARLANNTSDDRAYVNDITGGEVTFRGTRWLRMAGNIDLASVIVGEGWDGATPLPGKLHITGTATAADTVAYTVNDNGQLRIDAAIGGTVTLADEGVLTIGNAGWYGSVTKEAGATIGLAADANYTENDLLANIWISVADYNGTLTLNQDDTNIGAAFTDEAGIISTLAGTATQINFRGGDVPDRLLSIGGGVITGGRNVVIDRNMAFTGDNSYTGGTAILSGTTTVTSAAALGVGTIGVDNTGTLVVDAYGFTSAGVLVNLGGTLSLLSDSLTPITFAGGTIGGADGVRNDGALTDGADIAFAPAGELTFGSGLQMTASRTWNATSGTTVFEGNLTTDGTGVGLAGEHNLTKTGGGVLVLMGDTNAIQTLTVGDGFATGGVVAMGPAAGLANQVVINAMSGYGVAVQDHDYAEVDFIGSTGGIFLLADSDASLTMSNMDLTLGAADTATFSGTLTPAMNQYQLGGGGGILTVASDLNDVGGMTTVQIGRSSQDLTDPTHGGLVILTGNNGFTGGMYLYQAAAIDDASAIAGVDFANGNFVWVMDGASLDIGDMVVPPPPADIFDPATHAINMVGGGVSRNGAMLTVGDIASLFGEGRDYVIGGAITPGGDTTTVEDGALTSFFAFRKVGANTVILESTGVGNQYGGNTVVEDGTLVISDLASLGFTSGINVTGDAQMKILGTGVDTYFGGSVSLDDTATLFIASGEEVIAGAGVNVGGPAARTALVGGGTLTVGSGAVKAIPGAIFEIRDSSTLITRAETNAESPAGIFRVMEGSTLDFDTGVAAAYGNLGWLRPGSTVRFGNDIGQVTLSGHYGVRLEVDEADGPSADDNRYMFDIGAGTTVRLNDGGLDGVLASTVANPNNYASRAEYVSHLEKKGEGRLLVEAQAYNPGATGSVDVRALDWLVSEGTLEATGIAWANGLGATAYSYIAGNPSASANIAQQHLERIEVAGGATLTWQSTQGFLPASVYGGTIGDGWNAGEFILNDGATLRGQAAIPLVLGYQPGAETYLAYPTVRGNGVDRPTINVGGTINFRSGIEVDAGSTPDGLANINVTDGAITFSGDLPGAITGNMAGLNVAGGANVTMNKSEPNIETSSVQDSRLVLDPGAGNTINVGAAGHAMTLTDGQVRAATGVTDMGDTVITGATAGGGVRDLTFVEAIDDSFMLALDGSQVWTDNTWGTHTTRTVTMATGWHDFEVRVRNGTGGAGAQLAGGTLGFGVDFEGRGAADNRFVTGTESYYVNPTDDGSMNMFRYDMGGGVYAPGLIEGSIAGTGLDTTTPNPGGGVTLDVRMANTNAKPPWTDNINWVYTGQFYVPAVLPSVVVDAGAELRLGGFSDVDVVVRGKLVQGAANSTALSLNVAAGAVYEMGDGNLTVDTAQVNGLLSAGSAVITAGELGLGSSAKIDLVTGGLVIDYDSGDSLPDIMAWYAAGRGANAFWNGATGITSSAVAGDAEHLTAVGIIFNEDPNYGGLTSFMGQAVDATSVLLRYTWRGDADLDGDVDADDYDVIDNSFVFGPSGGTYGWWSGDFNGDGKIDGNDYDWIDNAFVFGGGPLGEHPVALGVPEPATMALLGLGLAVMALRRSKKA
jgi:hypothetical protein